MVATGQTTKIGSVISTEIIDVLNPTKSCVLDDEIIDRYQYGSTAGILGTTPVICGGIGWKYSDLTISKCKHWESLGVINYYKIKFKSYKLKFCLLLCHIVY